MVWRTAAGAQGRWRGARRRFVQTNGGQAYKEPCARCSAGCHPMRRWSLQLHIAAMHGLPSAASI
jgi:hypothetical protein